MTKLPSTALCLLLLAAAGAARPVPPPPEGGAPHRRPEGALADPREVHLAGLAQLTRGGENAEAYWSPDGTELIFQAHRPPAGCDQIFRLRADGSGTPVRVSNGRGRTTCAYFLKGGDRVIYASTHAAGPECPPPPDRSGGYVWAVYDSYELWSARPDGSEPVRLTDNRAYDAEATVCPQDGAVVFTSTRDGDLDLYRMSADGTAVQRLTDTPGYDGGAFFSPDCSKIVWRASRPAPGAELDEYRSLLARGLVRPGRLELWVANADGSDARQITYLGAGSFAPSFFPAGDRVIFSSNVGDPGGREFDLWAVGVDGSGLERITWTPGFDGFPVFSPDGSRLAFSSNRNQAAAGDTDVFVARWAEPPAGAPRPGGAAEPAPADRYAADVRWLAADAREGRGVGTRGLEESAAWLAGRFRALGLEPAGDPAPGGARGYRHEFPVPVALEVGESTSVAIDGAPLPRAAFQPAAFSASATAAGEVVAAGYGITAPELGIDDYRGVEAAGRIVAVRRFAPPEVTAAGAEAERRLSDLRYKAWNAREHGAAGLLIVDLPPAVGAEPVPEEAPLPVPAVDAQGDAGLPVALLAREAGARLFEPSGSHRAELAIAVAVRSEPAANVVGLLRAGAADRLPGTVLLGAHYDHLGMGGAHSLDPDARAPHNGADDNASGTAALLEAARELASRRDRLRRDVAFVAFSGEEEGALGSTAFTRRPPPGLAPGDLVAMLNMDMVGRLRGGRLTVLGGDSAEGWEGIVQPACARAGIECQLGGDGYGPSDHSPFYAAGVPVLHLFTGTHDDYHKPSDDAEKVNAAGGARIAGLAADLAGELAARPERLAYKNAPAPAPAGDARSYGASLGTVPDYAGDSRPGVLLAGVRPGSPAEKAGIRRGDLLVELAGTEIRDIQDFMFVLRRAKPGERARAVVLRDGEKLAVEVVFGVNTRLR